MLALRVFARVVEAGSFTRAADSLQMPKSTVSKAIQNLEDHLHVKLFHRTTRQVSLTTEGAAYYESTSRLVSELEEIDANLANAQAAPKGRIRVDVPAAVALQLIVPGLCAFHQRYPDIEIDLGAGDRLVDLIADNVDCVIRGGNISDESLVARRLGDLKFITCAAPAYIDRYGTPTHPRDLDGDHFVVGYFSAGSGRAFALDFTRDEERIELFGRSRVAVNDSNAYLAACLAGHGVIQLPIFSAKPHLDTGGLVALLPEWNVDTTPVFAVYPPNRRLSAKVRAFVDWMAECFAQMPTTLDG
ncbi:LysR family transcriptional regulator [Nitrogeniibacter mangrovi]|nr:LysR family transcriptional regulator [Nitrogeniibacter mangrovi]